MCGCVRGCVRGGGVPDGVVVHVTSSSDGLVHDIQCLTVLPHLSHRCGAVGLTQVSQVISSSQ